MRNAKLDRILSEARPEIARHWSSCIKAGLPGFSRDATDQVDRCVAGYFTSLKALPEPAPKDAILEEIKTLFLELDQLNQTAGGSLLETDERELLVPLVIDAATVSGLDAAEFDDDPTLQFRNF